MPDIRPIKPVNLALPLDSWLPRLIHADPAEAARARDTLAASLSSEDAALRDRAAGMLLKALTRDAPLLRAQALALLQSSWYPPSPAMAEQAVQAVIAALPGCAVEAGEVEDAGLLLANVCREAPGQVEVVAGGLEHPREAVRRAAVIALGRVGELAVPFASPLVAALAAPQPALVDDALQSVAALAPLAAQQIVPALVQLARSDMGARRYQALATLRGLVEEARHEALPAPAGLDGAAEAALGALGDEEAATRLEAVALLGLLGGELKGARKALQGRLGDLDLDVQAQAAASLVRLDPAHAEALAQLERLLMSDEGGAPQAALSAIESLEPPLRQQGALRALLERLHDGGPAELREALGELLAMG